MLSQHFLSEGSEIAAVDVLGVTLILCEPLDASLEVLRGIVWYTGFSEQFTQTAKLGVALERGVGPWTPWVLDHSFLMTQRSDMVKKG